jgi:hypothetical protein
VQLFGFRPGFGLIYIKLPSHPDVHHTDVSESRVGGIERVRRDAFVGGNANAKPAVVKQGVELFLQAKKFPDHGHILSLKMGALVQQVHTLQCDEFQYSPDDASGQGDKTDECCIAGHGVSTL